MAFLVRFETCLARLFQDLDAIASLNANYTGMACIRDTNGGPMAFRTLTIDSAAEIHVKVGQLTVQRERDERPCRLTSTILPA